MLVKVGPIMRSNMNIKWRNVKMQAELERRSTNKGIMCIAGKHQKLEDISKDSFLETMALLRS